MKYLLALALLFSAEGFAPTFQRPSTATARLSPLWYVNTDLPDVSEMRAGEMKQELESYGVSTKSMFDKAEFEKSLLEARFEQATLGVDEIKERINNGSETATTDSDTKRKTTWGKPRTERTKAQESSAKDETKQKFDNAFQEGMAKKISELKQELKDRGVSTSAFFEKVDMAKAYAESIADNVFNNKKSTKKNGANGASSQRSQRTEAFDPSYRDVNVEPFNAGLTILPGETVIDITDFVTGNVGGNSAEAW
ncbi:MAG: hypothetical protein SGARI_005970, partial [Bacillariaceae sp.]